MKDGMTDADVRRSTPGYVYGVAIHSSRQEEGKPSCECPCHLADAPRGAKGWYCDRCFGFLLRCVYPPETNVVDYSHEQAIQDGEAHPRPYMVSVPDYYFITKGNTLSDELGEHFKSEKKAEGRAKELNDADALASLKIPRTHRQRFDRYCALQDFAGWYWYDGEHHPLTRLPNKPGKYAVETWYDGDSGWSTHETLEEIREEVLSGDVQRIVDLDSGDDVPFSLSATVGDEVAAMREP